jgi:hypothetical protein
VAHNHAIFPEWSEAVSLQYRFEQAAVINTTGDGLNQYCNEPQVYGKIRKKPTIAAA